MKLSFKIFSLHLNSWRENPKDVKKNRKYNRIKLRR